MTRPLTHLCLLACFLAAAPLPAQSVGTDTDGDGLDDLLEVRYGSSTTVADTDGDGLTDLEEVLADMRPTLPDAGPRASLGKPSLHLEAYASGPDMVLQAYLVHTTSATDFRLSWWDGTTTLTGDLAALAPYLAGNQTLPLPSVPGVVVQALRFVLPRQALQGAGSGVLSAAATLDGSRLGDSLSLLDVDGVLAEVRWLRTAASSGPALGAAARDEAYLSALAPWELPVDDEPILDFMCILRFPRTFTIVNDYQYESVVQTGQCLPLSGMSCAPLTCSGAVGRTVRFFSGGTAVNGI